ncbi:MAG: hypothetical protein GX339_08750 [Tissierellia bacterium]|nr:hypothetical protein [Tissierellia bacterium]
MKNFKLVSLILVFCMIFSMTACTSQPTDTPTSPETPERAEEPVTPQVPQEPVVTERNISSMQAGEYTIDEMGVNPMTVKVTLGEKTIEAIDILSHAETEVVRQTM